MTLSKISAGSITRERSPASELRKLSGRHTAGSHLSAAHHASRAKLRPPSQLNDDYTSPRRGRRRERSRRPRTSISRVASDLDEVTNEDGSVTTITRPPTAEEIAEFGRNVLNDSAGHHAGHTVSIITATAERLLADAAAEATFARTLNDAAHTAATEAADADEAYLRAETAAAVTWANATADARQTFENTLTDAGEAAARGVADLSHTFAQTMIGVGTTYSTGTLAAEANFATQIRDLNLAFDLAVGQASKTAGLAYVNLSHDAQLEALDLDAALMLEASAGHTNGWMAAVVINTQWPLAAELIGATFETELVQSDAVDAVDAVRGCLDLAVRIWRVPKLCRGRRRRDSSHRSKSRWGSALGGPATGGGRGAMMCVPPLRDRKHGRHD